MIIFLDPIKSGVKKNFTELGFKKCQISNGMTHRNEMTELDILVALS